MESAIASALPLIDGYLFFIVEWLKHCAMALRMCFQRGVSYSEREVGVEGTWRHVSVLSRVLMDAMPVNTAHHFIKNSKLTPIVKMFPL